MSDHCLRVLVIHNQSFRGDLIFSVIDQSLIANLFEVSSFIDLVQLQVVPLGENIEIPYGCLSETERILSLSNYFTLVRADFARIYFKLLALDLLQ